MMKELQQSTVEYIKRMDAELLRIMSHQRRTMNQNQESLQGNILRLLDTLPDNMQRDTVTASKKARETRQQINATFRQNPGGAASRGLTGHLLEQDASGSRSGGGAGSRGRTGQLPGVDDDNPKSPEGGPMPALIDPPATDGPDSVYASGSDVDDIPEPLAGTKHPLTSGSEKTAPKKVKWTATGAASGSSAGEEQGGNAENSKRGKKRRDRDDDGRDQRKNRKKNRPRTSNLLGVLSSLSA